MGGNYEYDAVSDELIEIIVGSKYSRTERNQAAKKLFDLHTVWVNKQISKKIFNLEDIKDISQTVWLMVLQSEKLDVGYSERCGKFRAYLMAPIRWSILKHIDKLPFSTDEAGHKVALQSFEASAAMHEQSIDKYILETVIEGIIKPSLHGIDIKSRNVYVLNEFSVLFECDPELPEIAESTALR